MVNNIAKECFSKSILLLTIANLRTSFFSDGRKERITIKIQWTYFLSWDISQDSSWPKPIVVTCVQKTSFSHLLPKKTIKSPLEFNHPSSHLRPPLTRQKLSLPQGSFGTLREKIQSELRDRWQYQIWWIFGKVPKEGGVIFNTKMNVAGYVFSTIELIITDINWF